MAKFTVSCRYKADRWPELDKKLETAVGKQTESQQGFGFEGEGFRDTSWTWNDLKSAQDAFTRLNRMRIISDLTLHKEQ